MTKVKQPLKIVLFAISNSYKSFHVLFSYVDYATSTFLGVLIRLFFKYLREGKSALPQSHLSLINIPSRTEEM